MKRLWRERSKFYNRRNRRRQAASIRFAKGKKHRKRFIKKVPNAVLIITAPEVFDINNGLDRSTTLQFLRRMTTHMKESTRPIKLNFKHTEKMVSGAALLFKAELCRTLFSAQVTEAPSIIPPLSNKISQVLHQIGVYDLLEYTSNIQITHPDVVNWRYANGDEVIGEKYNEILGKYDGVIPDPLASSLYLGITEAMTNCHHHAYIMERGDGLDVYDHKKSWWMFSQEKDGKLSVVFTDLGIGIPVSLPVQKPGLWQVIVKRLGLRLKDGQVIEEAIRYSKSRTGKSYRGKGLRQLVEAVENIEGANLFIYSNKGLYTYISNETAVYNFSDSIHGTLISWSVPLQAEEVGDAEIH